MSARRRAPLALALVAGLAAAAACREDRATPEALRVEIAALERQRDELRSQVDGLLVRDPRLEGMPQWPVRVAVPTALARELIEKLVQGFVNRVTLELKNLKVKKSGSVRKVVTIGHYDLDVNIDHVIGRLETGRPDVRFGGNRVTLALPVRVASGSGEATISFKWNGSNVSGALCGDLDVRQKVSGRVKPDTYPVQGGLELSATAEQILASPRFPVIGVKLRIDPSAESWGAAQKILDDKTGVCGFVLEKVNVMKIVRGLIDRGFDVRLPTEKIKPVAVPVGIEPTMTVRGQPVALGIRLGGLAITPHVLWLGADVKVLSEQERLQLLERQRAEDAKAAKQAASRLAKKKA